MDTDTEGRKALKSLFNISVYSKNYLSKLLNVEKVSTRLIKNKLSLLTRLLHSSKTSDILMQVFQQPSRKGSFIHDVQEVSSRVGIDIISIIVSRTYPLIHSEFADIDQVIHNRLLKCLNSWNEAASRDYLIKIMEERVVRQD